jgi:hypothetical protein
MIVLKDMDELMTLDLPDDHIAAVHVCSCNPRILKHYPKDWLVTPIYPMILGIISFLPGNLIIVRTVPSSTPPPRPP